MRTQNAAVPPNTLAILKAIKGLIAAFSLITLDKAALVIPSIKAASVTDAFKEGNFLKDVLPPF